MQCVAVFERPFVKRFAVCYRTLVLSCSVLSVTLVYWCTVAKFVSDIAIFVLKRDVKLQLTNYCGQTFGRIKMKFGMHVGVGRGHRPKYCD